ncbi:Na+/H+ antiporter NhaC family protein [Rubrivirga sp. S365]|uniref:Na+/H+ antiporter NhaC family protein n=1 Tax=Rubrivirga sp. S365 TaxID=3076080 RepID=UPI0028C9F206|nr:Na+/H+ antiporter NhaC family protein [Rubrivirga sp. S365]MDT7857435.1 Na+/H+ antiporter NhaC family protein [Rubrivirga sp. S365]
MLLLALAAPPALAQDAAVPDPAPPPEAPVTLQAPPPPDAAPVVPAPPADAVVHDLDAADAEASAAVAEADGRNVGWLAILPALIAIAAALLFRQVIAALFLGVWLGAWIVTGDLATGWFTGLFATVQVYVLAALADADHAAIIIFTLMIGGTVGLIQKNGGTAAIVDVATKWARSAGRGQMATALLGTAVFFDDYANTLIVGGTMRPITDRLRVSREKLAYIVDSTAAPIACLALTTTWIGYEVGLIGTAIADLPDYDEGAYSVFLNSIPYSFYPILALFFVYLVAGTRRDFGPMLAAERRARETGQLYRPGSNAEAAEAEAEAMTPPPDAPKRLVNAVLPIAVLVVGVLAGLFITGRAAVIEGGAEMTITNVVGEANSYTAMMWASLASVLTAVALTVGQRILTLGDTIDAWYAGMRTMLLAIVILVLAWSLANVNDALGTADVLVDALSGAVLPGFVPAIVFLLAAATAFSTGSSWGTMGILMPLVIPLAWGVLAADGLHTSGEYHHIIYSTVSAVLAGAVWGDHCSPISDTTILSSLASSCDHIDHVRTQLPYALTTGGVALLLGTIPTGFNVPWWVMMPICALVLVGVIRFVGEPVEPEPEPEPVA